MNIIAKKQKEFYGTKNGLIKPIFERNDKEFKQVNPENYPNSGNIFITAGFDKFEDDYFYEFAYDKLQDNTKNYEEDLKSYAEGISTKNPCLKILTYYKGDVRKLPPNVLILENPEITLLEDVSNIYKGKGFEYYDPEDILTGFSRYPDLNKLRLLAKKIISAIS